MPHLPAIAHRTGSAVIPTPEHIIRGHHPDAPGHAHDFRRVIAGQRSAVGGNVDRHRGQRRTPSQIYGMVLPRPAGFSGAQRGQASQIYGMVLPRQGFSGNTCPAGTVYSHAKKACVPRKIKPVGGACPFPPCPDVRTALILAGAKRKKRRSIPRLSTRMGLAGAMDPASYPDYPGNYHRTEAIKNRRAYAGGERPMKEDAACFHGCMNEFIIGDDPDPEMFSWCVDHCRGQKKGSPTGTVKAHSARSRHRGFAGGDPRDHAHEHAGGACCDSCAGGGPCEGCDGAGGCGKPNCGCNG